MQNHFNSFSGMLEIVVPGDLLSTNADRFRTDAVSALEAQSTRKMEWRGVKVDLTGARMVDSAGLNAIVSLIRKAKSLGKRASIHVKDAHVHRICLFTRLDIQAEIVQV
jgi:ABC-type transporter Mla MlaB component